MPTPARIAFVLPSFAAGGAQRVLITLAASLDRLRFEPFLLVFEDSGPWRALVPADLRVVALGRANLRTALLQLVLALRRERPVVVVSTLAYVNGALLLAKSCLDPQTRIVVREANTPRRHSVSMLGRLAYDFSYRVLYRRADRIICPAEYLVDQLECDYGIDRNRMVVLSNPVDEAVLRIAAVPTSRRSGSGVRFVAVGRLGEQKGYDRLLDDISKLPADAHVTIFGEGECRAKLEQQATRLDLTSRLTLAGFNPQPAPWIAGADALLLPSRWEGMPNVALEALACGCPVISTPEAGGIAEIEAQALPGAVTLARSGAEFVAAMRNVRPRTDTALRPSLLPDRYRLEHAAAGFAAILAA